MSKLICWFVIGGLFVVGTPAIVATDSLTLFRELLTNNGFYMIEHSIVTDDGYLLSLHRIVQRDRQIDRDYTLDRKPIILQHGLLGSSNNFFLNGQNSSDFTDQECGNNFGFCLVATQRYDVWSLNSRANGYSKGRSKDNKKRFYWAYSFDQMARYDLPAAIDHIQRITGHSKIGYVGHSQGTISMFALLVSDYGQKYHDIVHPFVAWGPPVYLQNMSSKIMLIRLIEGLLDIPIELTTLGLANPIIRLFCKDFPGGTKFLCPEFIEQVYGKTTTFDFKRLPEFLKFAPNPSSSWSLLHLIQLYHSHIFQHFDYGRRLNRKYYNQTTPPRYKLENFPEKVPIKMFNGATDGFIPMANAIKLWNEIDPDKSHSELVEVEYGGKWNHLDYLFSKQAGRLVYKPSLDFIDQYST